MIVGKHVNTVIGEEYVDMISYWWRAPKNTWVPGYTAMGGAVTQGAACDNDVHEVFKALGEVALTKHMSSRRTTAPMKRTTAPWKRRTAAW